MEKEVESLMANVLPPKEEDHGVFMMTGKEAYSKLPELSRQEEFDHITTRFAIDQNERIKRLETRTLNIKNEAVQLLEEVGKEIRERIKENHEKPRKIEKITRYPDTEVPKPSSNLGFSETLTKRTSFHAPEFISPKSLCVNHVRTIFPSPPLVRESTFCFKPGASNNQDFKSQYDMKDFTPQVTYKEEVEETMGTPTDVEPIDETRIEDLGLNTCNHDIPLSPREVPSFGETRPQPQPVPSYPSLDLSLGDQRGPEPPIKPYSLDSFQIKVVDPLTTHAPPSPNATSFHPKDIPCYYHPCIDDLKGHYGFKPGLLGHSGSLGVNFSNWEIIEDDWEFESKEVSFLGDGFSLPVKLNKLGKDGRIKELHHLEHIVQRPLFQHKAPFHHNGVYRYHHPHLNSSVGEPSPLSIK